MTVDGPVTLQKPDHKPMKGNVDRPGDHCCMVVFCPREVNVRRELRCAARRWRSRDEVVDLEAAGICIRSRLTGRPFREGLPRELQAHRGLNLDWAGKRLSAERQVV